MLEEGAPGTVAWTAEAVVRQSYGRLLAILVRRGGDITAAEDALADAFAAALAVWPRKGVPDRPEAWLLTAARRVIGHGERHRAVTLAARPMLDQLRSELEAREATPFPDERLKLLFVCAHPAIDEAVRAPLMLQCVLGLDAARIARAFLMRPATIGQRLVRAKAKIRDAGIRYAVPDAPDLQDRLVDVLAAVYAAYTIGWDSIPGATSRREAMTEEALFLARLVVDLLPDEAEPKGLLALLLYNEARQPARRSPDGAYIPLSRQDPRLWHGGQLREAEALLRAAARIGQFGRFQTEAAIQSLQCQALVSRQDCGAALLGLFDVLVDQSPTIGAAVARAAAYGEHADPAIGLGLLDALPPERVAEYQPFWATRLHLAEAAGQEALARAALPRALALTNDAGIRNYLKDKAFWLRSAPESQD